MSTNSDETSTSPTASGFPNQPRPEFPHSTEPTFSVFMWGFFTGVVTTVALAVILSEGEEL